MNYVESGSRSLVNWLNGRYVVDFGATGVAALFLWWSRNAELRQERYTGVDRTFVMMVDASGIHWCRVDNRCSYSWKAQTAVYQLPDALVTDSENGPLWLPNSGGHRSSTGDPPGRASEMERRHLSDPDGWRRHADAASASLPAMLRRSKGTQILQPEAEGEG